MKKVFCLFLTAMFLLMLGGCSSSVEKLDDGSNSVKRSMTALTTSKGSGTTRFSTKKTRFCPLAE